MKPNEAPFVQFRGVKIDNVSYRDAYEAIRQVVDRGGKGYVCLTDVGNVIGASQDPSFREAVNSSLLSLADGTPLAWYARLTGCGQIERISGMDLMVNMFSERDGLRHFLFGDTEETIGSVIRKAREIDGNIDMSGYSPPFKEFDDEDNRLLLERINSENADIIWVCLGGEKQDKWMFRNLPGLKRGVLIGVGAAFRWFTGDLKSPPRILQKMGLQWIYRIVQANLKDPKKYFKMTFNKVLKRKIIFAYHFPGEVMKGCKRSWEEA